CCIHESCAPCVPVAARLVDPTGDRRASAGTRCRLPDSAPVLNILKSLFARHHAIIYPPLATAYWLEAPYENRHHRSAAGGQDIFVPNSDEGASFGARLFESARGSCRNRQST